MNASTPVQASCTNLDVTSGIFSQNSSTTHVDTKSTNSPKPGNEEVKLTDQANFLPTQKVLICFIGLSLCILVTQLDTVVTATSLSTISAAFNAGSIASWVPTAYLLTSTSFSPLYGRLSDIFGRKIILTVALVVLMVGNLAAGFSTTIVQVIVSRGVAGAGGGAIGSLAYIIISDIVTLRQRGKYQAIIATISALGFGLGPLLGGVLAQQAGWQWCFWFNIPITIVAVTAVNLVLPLKPVEGNVRDKLLLVDYVGCGLTLVGSTLILLPLIWGGVTFPWNSPIILGTLIGGLAICVLFVIWEWRGAKLPVLPMYIFKYSTVSGIYIVGLLSGMIKFSMIFYLPQFFQAALGYTPVRAGVLMIAFLTSNSVVNQVAVFIMSRFDRYRMLVLSGFAIWSIACGLTSTINPHSHTGILVLYLLLLGVGSGQTIQTTTLAAQAAVPRRDMAVVTAFRNFTRMLGGTLGLPVGSAIINNTLRTSMHSLLIPERDINLTIDNPALLHDPASLGLSPDLAKTILYDGYIKGFQRIFILNASLAAISAITTLFLIKDTSLSREEDEQQLKEAVETDKCHGEGEKTSGL
ncbi:hypothetical protein D9756_002066 [Leucocoprinus leucothites]|uniref:Major facilitator superfamily (MFS) profile domain-containing protein n=1 Tax=Leucocoprinus leucothites TaxID=201217 RepID=A0A8H5LLT4_9AGAR|nr:hypothetical protein D9756_002066 [Leucoagaricus leucothites]